MKKQIQEQLLKLVLVVFSLATVSWTPAPLASRDLASEQGTATSSKPYIVKNVEVRPSIEVTNKPLRKSGVKDIARAGNSGPRPDVPARTTSVDYWTNYWTKELAKTKNPIFQSAMQFQLNSLSQARIYLNATLSAPAEFDPATFILPELKPMEADVSFTENYNSLLLAIGQSSIR